MLQPIQRAPFCLYDNTILCCSQSSEGHFVYDNIILCCSESDERHFVYDNIILCCSESDERHFVYDNIILCCSESSERHFAYMITPSCVAANPASAILFMITPSCVAANPASVLKADACEHDQLQIACPVGQRLEIIKAVYGRSDATTCPRGILYSTSCTVDVTAAVFARCNGQQVCFGIVLSLVAGVPDPCFGTYKYLTVEYRCIT